MGTTRFLVSLLASSSALVSGLFIPEPAVQAPLTAAKAHLTPQEVHRAWDAPPSDGQSNNLIFFRLATLLQHWPNTRYPSGQSVAPGTVPIGTTLYHGRSSIDLPTSPDWLAFDPEHSMMFTRGADSRLFTFVTTRPLRVLYFDGSSAAKLSSGAMDTQDLLAWGKLESDPMRNERKRIVDLCEWGKDLGIDGYVRMEMSFEIMHCDFSQGLELVSSLHMLPTEGGGPSDPTAPPPPPFRPFANPDLPKIPPPFPTGSPHHPPHFPSEPRPPNWKGSLPSNDVRGFEVFQAGAWHGRAPGETRVKIDAARLVSLYDPALQSGVGAREGREKVLHRGNGLTDEDVSTWRGWVKQVVRKDAPATSGVDWPALTTVIMDRYGARIEYLHSLLEPERASRNVTAAVQDVREQLLLMLVTDITADTTPRAGTPTNSASPARVSQIRRRETQNNTWVEPIATHCSSFLVSHLPNDKFTREERTLHSAVSGTQAEICRVLALLWSEAYDPSPAVRPEDLLKGWKKQVDSLIGWLDWPMWNRCRPECSLNTMCFIPTWPMGIGRGPGGGGNEDLSKVDWTPKCIPRRKSMIEF